MGGRLCFALPRAPLLADGYSRGQAGCGMTCEKESSANRPGSALVWLPCTWSFPQDTASQVKRREAAARRLPRFCDQCGARDPIVCRCCEPEPPLSEHALEGWRAAIERTLPIGPALVPIEVLQRLWRNGRADRVLAERVWAETGGQIA